MEKLAAMPPEVIVDPEQKRVFVTPLVAEALPGSLEAFHAADATYLQNPEAYLKSMEESVFSFRSTTGADIECSLIPGAGSELLVMWAPFSDSAPRSSAEDIFHYTQLDDPGLLDKAKAAPNSWNQLTKSSVVSELLRAVDRDMSVLTIFSPLPSFPKNAYSSDEYRRIRHGDFSPAARLALEAVREAQDRLHGPRSETRLDEIHAHGASLGASTAIGMANGLFPLEVKSVTAQELIVAPGNVFPDLAKRFTIGGIVGRDSNVKPAEDTPFIAEPFIRHHIDRAGNEPAMFARMLQGMSKVSRLKGLTRPERNQTPRLIEKLLENEVSVLVPLAENSGLTHDTPDYLPGSGESVVNIRAVEGQRVAHLIDEHVGATALMAVMHVARTRK